MTGWDDLMENLCKNAENVLQVVYPLLQEESVRVHGSVDIAFTYRPIDCGYKPNSCIDFVSLGKTFDQNYL